MSLDNHKDQNEDDAINEFRNKLNESIEKGHQITNAGRELTESGQYIVDLSTAIKNAIPIITPSNNIEELITGFESLNKQLDSSYSTIHEITPVISSSSGSTTSLVLDAFNNQYNQFEGSELNKLEAENSIDEINQVAQRIADKDEVISLMKLFKLDIALQGQKSSLELFIIAHDAFGSPVSDNNPVVTSLIPIRESINLMIDKLIKERPIQEQAGNERAKIISIGNQLKNDYLDENIIISWAEQWHSMNNQELSPSKNKEISRKEWQYRLNHSTIFIKSILEGLDVNKLRSNLRS